LHHHAIASSINDQAAKKILVRLRMGENHQPSQLLSDQMLRASRWQRDATKMYQFMRVNIAAAFDAAVHQRWRFALLGKKSCWTLVLEANNKAHKSAPMHCAETCDAMEW
jgi:hypothetical protein